MDKLKVNFVAHGGAHLASHRMRVTKPTELLNVGVSDIEATISSQRDKKAHVNIFSKHFDQKGNLLGVSSGKDLGFYSIFDVCDDHFDRKHQQYYKAMCVQADLITCNSENMQERILEVTGKTAKVIRDPITFPTGEFKTYQKGRTPEVLWYGHGSNAGPLKDWLEHLGVRVTAICDSNLNHPNVDYVRWKPMVVERRIGGADIVIIPTTDHPWTKCKSPNRAVDAINAGKFVITDNREIYGDLGEFMYIVDSPEEIPLAISYWKDHPKYVEDQVKLGQEYIRDNYGDSIVLDGWLGAFRDLGLIGNPKEAKENA